MMDAQKSRLSPFAAAVILMHSRQASRRLASSSFPFEFRTLPAQSHRSARESDQPDPRFRRTWGSTSRSRTENEPSAADGANQRGFIGSVDLATQSTHVHIDKVCFRNEFVVPHVLEESCARHQLATALHHIFE
jgi:hypothetical protein